jgi:hypothetical protein
MKNPEENLKVYLKTLVHNLIYLNSILDQVNEFYSWLSDNGEKAIHEGGWFYKVSLYSFKRILTIEACKLLLDREERSLIDWLNKAHEHAGSLNPTEYKPRQGYKNDLRRLSVEEFRSIIDEQRERLDINNELILNMKNLRDKGFAHGDKEYFENPEKLETDFLITWDEFNEIYSLMSSIVKKHYSLLFNSDMDMHLTAYGSIKNVLMHTRAFQRIWNNRTLIDMDLKLYAFKSDDYDPDDIFIN